MVNSSRFRTMSSEVINFLPVSRIPLDATDTMHYLVPVPQPGCEVYTEIRTGMKIQILQGRDNFEAWARMLHLISKCRGWLAFFSGETKRSAQPAWPVVPTLKVFNVTTPSYGNACDIEQMTLAGYEESFKSYRRRLAAWRDDEVQAFDASLLLYSSTAYWFHAAIRQSRSLPQALAAISSACWSGKDEPSSSSSSGSCPAPESSVPDIPALLAAYDCMRDVPDFDAPKDSWVAIEIRRIVAGESDRGTQQSNAKYQKVLHSSNVGRPVRREPPVKSARSLSDSATHDKEWSEHDLSEELRSRCHVGDRGGESLQLEA